MYRRYGDIMWGSADAPEAATAAATTPPAAAATNAPLTSGGGDRPRKSSSRRPARRVAETSAAPLHTIELHGVRLHAITERRCIEHILSELDAGNGGMVVTPNLDHLRRCTRDLSFGALVAEADLVIPDGMPLIWASRIQGTPLPQRVAGSDLISSLSAAAATRGRSIYLLGGAPGTADAAAKVLTAANPELRIAGTMCPEVGFDTYDERIDQIAAALAEAKPDIVYVALGSPKQEKLIARIRTVLPKAWWLGVGISFSFLCGDVKRAPRFLQRLGLEWVHRLVQDPRRLFRRYIVVGLPFGGLLMGRSALRGISNRFRRNSAASQPLNYSAASNGDGNGDTYRGNGNGNGDVIDALAAATPAATTTATTATAEPRRAANRIAEPGTVGHVGSLNRLRAVVLLGGSVRSTPLSEAVERSVLDLPLDADGSIFNHWLAHASELARHAGLEKLPVRVMVNRTTPEPASAAPEYYGTFRVERDLSEYRGTGGVLRDLAVNYADDDLILVCNAAQILLDPLAAIATALDRKIGDVTIVSHKDGTPSGVQLVSCKCLRLIPDTGFVDMKEQALPLIASKYDVTVMHRRRPTGLPIRSLADYVLAMRHYHRRRLGQVAQSDPLAEDWAPAFAIVEQGATVDSRAHVHDSVILKGGVVEAGAVVVRSIVCPGGVVKKDKSAVDLLVCGVEQ